MAQELDIYEFPAGYSGRKTYVSVRGHSRSIPVVYTYKGTDRRNYLLPEFGGDWSGYENFSTAVSAPTFIPDIGEYVSPLDGSFIRTRSEHRDHIARHNVIEVGNERIGNRTPDMPITDRETRNALKKHLEEVKAMPQSEYDNRVAKQTYDTAGDVV